MKWISLKDEYPPLMESVDFSCGHEVIAGWRESRDDEDLQIYSSEAQEWIEGIATHWMHKRKPFKEKE